jgi:threonine efflux protein
MNHVWLNIFSVLFVFAMAIISPGPNFVLVVNTAINRSRREGAYTAAGVAVGSMLFAVAGLLGLLLLINSSTYFATIIHYLGSGYLIYLGFRMMLEVKKKSFILSSDLNDDVRSGGVGCFVRGLLTNMTNPKAWAFYLSLFALVGYPEFPLWAKLFLCFAVFVMAMCWYGTITLVIADDRVKNRFMSVQKWLNLLFGIILIMLGGKLWFGL